ncbi:MAG: prolyl oligopeptidase family serine peptidase [Gemmatimonadetes bacterium]|nr:prolyl oligopeptidase family serine peptidase [Gemmatimonadota bacterium]
MRRLALLALLAAAPLSAQQAFDLSVRNIMRGPELYGREPGQVRFTADGQWIYFRWLAPGAAWNADLKPYRVAARAGATPEVVTDAHMDSVAPMLATGRRSRDGRLEVLSANGDLWLRTRTTAARGAVSIAHRRITQTNGAESDPKFSLDEKQVLFVRDNNAYAFEIATGLTRQLTDLRSGTAPRDAERPAGQRGALAEQQRFLFEVIRDELQADSIQRANRRAAESRALPTVWIPQAERITTVSISPDAKSAILSTFTPAAATKGSDVPDFINADGYPRMIPGRTKVGDAQATQKIGHLDLATGKVTWLKLVPDSGSAGGAQVGDWSDDGRFALVFVTSADFKHRYLWSVASAGGAMQMVDRLRDEAWVNGPCFGCVGWTPAGKAWFVSEESGYSHVYVANADGTGKQALTSGAWEVLQVDRAADNVHFEMVTSEPSPFTRQAYRMAMTGGARTRLTTGDGGHAPVVSPADASVMATVYSTPNTPPELFLARAGQAQMAQLTTSTTAEFRSYAWKVPPIVMLDGEDGTKVPARLYDPKAFGKASNGAAVIFVHGAGYLHNVHNWWSTYSREYMFHHLLAERGYTVLDIDYRGSAGYGRDWRTAIYRWMGGKDLDDQVSGSKYLTSQFGIQPERIGLYGGSYGGFMTLMALFTKPQYFGAGAGLRSVTDWASYNHGYTGRILNLPQDDTLSYRRSSPIFFADGLQDPLLIAHGMVDTNVQFQDVVHLSQRLIELGKVDWEMAVYPVEDHGFVRPSSWTDEYRRILELFDRTIGPNGTKARR